MELGMIGLGRMGGNMSTRLLGGNHRVVVYDVSAEKVRALERQGAVAARTLSEVAEKLSPPRIVWSMVPAGLITENTVKELSDVLSSGDTIIDGGNSHYRDSIRRARELARNGLTLLDVGVSGGIWGLTQGYCLMVGGDAEAYRRAEPILKTLAPSPDRGYAHVGASGAGHFAKMVHNGIEYGLMQAYAEGFELMQAKKEFQFDLPRIAEVWRYGSVIRSWLLDLAAGALEQNPGLEGIEAYVEDSGEGRWMVQEAVELAVPLPAITQALQARFRSRQKQPFSGRLLAVLRRQFGGHSVVESKH